MNMNTILRYAASLESSLSKALASDPKYHGCQVTCAPNGFSSGSPTSGYDRFVALTQRIIYDSKVVCYVCYRVQFPKVGSVPPQFSSFEILGPTYDRSRSRKIHINDSSFGATERDREIACTKAVFDDICSRIDAIRR